MTKVWGAHNDRFNTELVDGGFISVRYDEVNQDLLEIGLDREALKGALTAALPDEKPRASPAGQESCCCSGPRWLRAT